MSLINGLRYRLRSLLQRRSFDAELDEELRFHLEQEAMQRRHVGEADDEARYAALRRLGNRTRVHEQVRAASLVGRLDPLAQDLAYALRQLRRNPGFAIVVILTLALGIGAATSIFSAVDGVILRPLPFAQPDRLVRFHGADSLGVGRGQLSPPNILTLREQRRIFAEVAAYNTRTPTLTGHGDAEKLKGARVSAGFFEIFGVAPILGRAIEPADNRGEHGEVVVLSHGLWQRLFGGDPSAVGATITLDGRPSTVIGVMRPDFDAPGASQLWSQLDYNETFVASTARSRNSNWLWAIGRLQPGVTVEHAQRELHDLARRLTQEYPASHTNVGFAVVGLQQDSVREVRTPLLLLFGAVGLLLLIACANVAGLLLARAASRQGELAVRTALGAGRGRLVRQLVVETMVLCTAGGALGLVLAAWSTSALVALEPVGLPRLEELRVGGTAAGFAIAITLGTVLLVGLVPALQATRGLARTLRASGRSPDAIHGAARLREGLVVAELALAVMLLAGAGLLVRSFTALVAVDPGFRAERVATFPVELPQVTYDSADAVRDFYVRLLDRLRAVPGVEASAAVYRLPLASSGIRSSFDADGWPPAAPGERRGLEIRSATPAYFETMGLRLRRGRGLLASDAADAPRAAVINEAAVRTYFPDVDPIGRRLRFRGNMVGEEPFTVVGVVGDVRHYGLDRPAEPEIYFPHAQVPLARMMVVLRSSGDPLLLDAAVRQAVRGLDPDVPVPGLRTLEQVLGASVSRPRFLATLLSTFAGAALTLAAFGVFGLLSYSVAQRTREIGVRVALGAVPSSILRLIIGRGVALCTFGLGIGIAGTLALSRVLAGVLFGVRPADPPTIAAVVVLLGATALMASAIPAIRAARVDPMVALRSE